MTQPITLADYLAAQDDSHEAELLDAMTDESTILRALASLELKLTSLISQSLASIQRDHNQALLDQTKVNATFATRERVEAISRAVDAYGAEILALNKQDAHTLEEQKLLRHGVDEVCETIDRRTLAFFTTAAGWLVIGAFTVGGAILSFTLTHLIH